MWTKAQVKTCTNTFLTSLWYGWATNQKESITVIWWQRGINNAVNTCTFYRSVDSWRKISQAKQWGRMKHRKRLINLRILSFCLKKRFPEAWKVLTRGCFYSGSGGGLVPDSGHSYTSGSRESYSLRHIRSLTYLALSSGSGYLKAILLA